MAAELAACVQAEHAAQRRDVTSARKHRKRRKIATGRGASATLCALLAAGDCAKKNMVKRARKTEKLEKTRSASDLQKRKHFALLGNTVTNGETASAGKEGSAKLVWTRGQNTSQQTIWLKNCCGRK